MSNIHTPERLPGESFEDYKARRVVSRAINEGHAKGAPLPDKRATGANRRHATKAAGGIRQYKRAQYAMRDMGIA